jgi:hypothetical protein
VGSLGQYPGVESPLDSLQEAVDMQVPVFPVVLTVQELPLPEGPCGVGLEPAVLVCEGLPPIWGGAPGAPEPCSS